MPERILVATGDPQAAAVMRFVLGLGGGAVEIVREIDETVNWLRSRPAYDLLVLDGMLPLPSSPVLEDLGEACRTVPVLWVCRNPVAQIPEPLRRAGAVSCPPDEVAARAKELMHDSREKEAIDGRRDTE